MNSDFCLLPFLICRVPARGRENRALIGEADNDFQGRLHCRLAAGDRAGKGFTPSPIYLRVGYSIIPTELSNFFSKDNKMSNNRILFNTRVRIYPNGSRIVTYSSLPVFSPRFDPEDNDIEDINDLDDSSDSFFDKRRNFEKDNVLRAAVRARQRIFDIGFLNDWSYFCTFTFSDPLPQRDTSVALKVVQNWLKYEVFNYRKEHPDFMYLCVPEFGGKNGNVHLHFLTSDLPVFDSGCVLIKGYDRPVKRCNLRDYDVVLDTVYNVPLWNKGFSTAIRIYKNDGALSHYLSKYMTKDQKMIFGKYYWSSQNLSREPKMEYYNTPDDLLNQKMVSGDLGSIMLPGTRVRLVYESFVSYSKNS